MTYRRRRSACWSDPAGFADGEGSEDKTSGRDRGQHNHGCAPIRRFDQEAGGRQVDRPGESAVERQQHNRAGRIRRGDLGGRCLGDVIKPRSGKQAAAQTVGAKEEELVAR